MAASGVAGRALCGGGRRQQRRGHRTGAHRVSMGRLARGATVAGAARPPMRRSGITMAGGRVARQLTGGARPPPAGPHGLALALLPTPLPQAAGGADP